MKKITQEKLNEIIRKHEKWTKGERGGKCADLRGMDLSYLILSNANLSHAEMLEVNMEGAIVEYANLRYVNLYRANLHNVRFNYSNLQHAHMEDANMSMSDLVEVNLNKANMRFADLSGANLYGANLLGAQIDRADMTGVNICGANLTDANLFGTKTTDIICGPTTAGFLMCCPEEGSFIGYKKANGYIVKLLIPEDARRSSATSRKCRCDKAKVLSITNLDGSDSEITSVTSSFNEKFIYEVGKMVEEPNFNKNRWIECSTGIHFFITRDEAVNY